MIFNYLAKMTFLQLLINMFNIFNTWNGLNFKQIIDFSSDISNKIPKLKRIIGKVDYNFEQNSEIRII